MDVGNFLRICTQYQSLGSAGERALYWLLNDPGTSPARFHDGTLRLVVGWIELVTIDYSFPELQSVYDRIQEYLYSPPPQ